MDKPIEPTYVCGRYGMHDHMTDADLIGLAAHHVAMTTYREALRSYHIHVAMAAVAAGPDAL